MSSGKQTAKTLVSGVVLMVVAGFAPAIVAGLLGWSNASNIAIMAGLAAVVACMGGSGWRTGLQLALPFSILAALTVWAAPNAWWAALVLALAAFLRGYAARFGLHDALMMSVISLGFFVATPPTSVGSIPAPIFTALVSLASMLWATFVIFVLRKQLHPRQHQALERIRVLAFSTVLAILVGAVTWIVVNFSLGHTGGWIILTVLVVFQPSLGAGFHKALHRAAGTAAGFVIAIAVGAVLPSGPWVAAMGTVFLMAAFTFMLQGRAYWMYAAMLTTAIVLLESGGSTVDVVARERLWATLVGVTITLLVMLALAPLAKHLAVKGAPASS